MRQSAERVLSVMMPIANEERTLATILCHTLAQPAGGGRGDRGRRRVDGAGTVAVELHETGSGSLR